MSTFTKPKLYEMGYIIPAMEQLIKVYSLKYPSSEDDVRTLHEIRVSCPLCRACSNEHDRMVIDDVTPRPATYCKLCPWVVFDDVSCLGTVYGNVLSTEYSEEMEQKAAKMYALHAPTARGYFTYAALHGPDSYTDGLLQSVNMTHEQIDEIRKMRLKTLRIQLKRIRDAISKHQKSELKKAINKMPYITTREDGV